MLKNGGGGLCDHPELSYCPLEKTLQTNGWTNNKGAFNIDVYVNSPCKGSVKKWGRGSSSLFLYLVKELFIKTGEGVWQPLLISSKGSVKKF